MLPLDVYTDVTAEAMALTAARHTVQETRSERVAELFEAHHERLYRLARRMSGSADEARDLVQDNRSVGAPRSGADQALGFGLSLSRRSIMTTSRSSRACLLTVTEGLDARSKAVPIRFNIPLGAVEPGRYECR